MRVATTMELEIGSSKHPKGTVLDLPDPDAKALIAERRAVAKADDPAPEAPIAIQEP